MPQPKQPGEVLLDPPHSVPEHMDQLSVLNELLAKRQEELDDAQHQLMLLQAKILSERAQWTQQKADEEHETTLKAQRLEEVWRLRIQDAEQQLRGAEQSAQQQREMTTEAERRVEDIANREHALADLSKERLEIEMLRRQTEERANAVESRWSASQEAKVKGQEALMESMRKLEEVELRNLRLNDRETSLQAREEHVTLKEKQQELASQELDRRLADYANVKASSQPASESPVLEDVQPTEEEHVESRG